MTAVLMLSVLILAWSLLVWSVFGPNARLPWWLLERKSRKLLDK